MSLSIWIDSADLSALAIWTKHSRVSGVTTNPSLMRKAGVTDYRQWATEVLRIVPKTMPVSFEVVSDTLEGMTEDAKELCAWAPNVYAKIPIQTPKGQTMAGPIKMLSLMGLRLNVTCVLTEQQADAAIRALAPKADAIVSIFCGRITDTGRQATDVVDRAFSIRGRGTLPRILWGGARTLADVEAAERFACDIITLPPDLLAKLPRIGSSLDAYALETVQQFDADAKAMGYKLC